MVTHQRTPCDLNRLRQFHRVCLTIESIGSADPLRGGGSFSISCTARAIDGELVCRAGRTVPRDGTLDLNAAVTALFDEMGLGR